MIMICKYKQRIYYLPDKPGCFRNKDTSKLLKAYTFIQQQWTLVALSEKIAVMISLGVTLTEVNFLVRFIGWGKPIPSMYGIFTYIYPTFG